MPTREQILQSATEIANGAVVFALLWHLAIAIALVLLVSNWRPSARLAAALLVLPLASVATFALVYGNPFNGAMFVLFAGLLAWRAARASARPSSAGPRWAAALGAAMIGYAWVYPHFLDATSWLAYLALAPVGLVPCPSLALVIGFALLGGGIDRGVGLLLGTAGLLYGAIGIAGLGVWLDLGLVAGAVGLTAISLGERHRRGQPRWVRVPAR